MSSWYRFIGTSIALRIVTLVFICSPGGINRSQAGFSTVMVAEFLLFLQHILRLPRHFRIGKGIEVMHATADHCVSSDVNGAAVGLIIVSTFHKKGVTSPASA
jgi:hypothetical protein